MALDSIAWGPIRWGRTLWRKGVVKALMEKSCSAFGIQTERWKGNKVKVYHFITGSVTCLFQMCSSSQEISSNYKFIRGVPHWLGQSYQGSVLFSMTWWVKIPYVHFPFSVLRFCLFWNCEGLVDILPDYVRSSVYY